MSNMPPPPSGEVPPDPFGAPARPRPDLGAPSPDGAVPPTGMPPPPRTATGVPPAAGMPIAPAGYQPYPGVGVGPVAAKSGKLLAGGIVAVVLAVFTVLIGLVIALLGDAVNDLADDFGNAFVLIGLVVVAFGGFGLAAGIGAIMRRQWGRICAIVYGAVNGVFALLALVSEPDGGGVVYLAMSVAIVLLCAMGSATPA